MDDVEPRQPTVDADFSNRVIQEIFDIFIGPELVRRGNPNRAEVRKALVLLPADGPPQVLLNDEAALAGTARATRPIAAGETITVDDVDDITELRPTQDPGDSGWVAFIAMPNGRLVAAFDFRRNKDRARRLLALAEQYYATAKDAVDRNRVPVAIDALHASAELAVTALMNLTMEHDTKVRRRSGLHSARTGWLNQYSRLGNLPADHSYAMRRLGNLRPAARYGEAPLSLKEGELPRLLQTVQDLLEAARGRVGDALPPLPDVP